MRQLFRFLLCGVFVFAFVSSMVFLSAADTDATVLQICCYIQPTAQCTHGHGHQEDPGAPCLCQGMDPICEMACPQCGG